MNSYSYADFSHMAEMAVFAAELTRQNIRYFITEIDGRYRVTITGY